MKIFVVNLFYNKENNMLLNQTLSKLKSMKLTGMSKALEYQLKNNEIESLSFEERLSLLVDSEETIRNDRRFQSRIRSAKLSQQACLEDVDYKADRGLNKQVFLRLGENTYIKEHKDIIISGLTGTGKSYLASALVHKACLVGLKAHFIRVPKLFRELAVAKLDGSYNQYLNRLAKFEVVVFDDWGLAPMTLEEARDFFEIIEERHKKKSTIITSQVPLKNWFEIIGDSTIADAIMDRLVNNSYKIELSGSTMRKSNKVDKKSEAN